MSGHISIHLFIRSWEWQITKVLPILWQIVQLFGSKSKFLILQMYSPNCNLNWFRDQQVQDFKIIVIWFESILKRQIAFQRIKKSKIKPCILKDIRQKDYSLSSWRFKNTEKLTFDDHRTKSILKNCYFWGKTNFWPWIMTKLYR